MSTNPPKRNFSDFTEEQENDYRKFVKEFHDRIDSKGFKENIERLEVKLMEGIGTKNPDSNEAIHVLLPNGCMKPAFSIAMDYQNQTENNAPLSVKKLLDYKDALAAAMKIDKLSSLLPENLGRSNELTPIINEYRNIKDLSVDQLRTVLPKMERQINAIMIDINEQAPDHAPPQQAAYPSDNEMIHVAAQWNLIQKNHGNPKWEALEKKKQAEENESFVNPMFKKK